MEIRIVNDHGLTARIEISVDNANISEDISEVYSRKTNGFPVMDISDRFLGIFLSACLDLAQYRKREYGGTELMDLIVELFKKLPKERAIELTKELYDDYIY